MQRVVGAVIETDHMNKLHAITHTVEAIDHAATGQLARQVRIKAGLSLRDMARLLDLSAPYVSDLERGRRNWNEHLIQCWNISLFLKPERKR
jgi:DNA-binding XRE family transcriptional regulator